MKTSILSLIEGWHWLLSDALMDEGKKKRWIVISISMKDDWKTIFPPSQ